MVRWNGGVDFTDFHGEWTLLRASDGDALRSALREQVISGDQVASRVAGWCRDPMIWPALLELCEELTGHWGFVRTSDDAEHIVIPLLQRAFEQGEVVALLIPWGAHRPDGKPEEEGVLASGKPLESDLPVNQVARVLRRISEKTFLDLSVVDDEGNPLTGRGYKLQLPNGLTEEGKLGASARLERTGIDPGTALLTLVRDRADPVEASDLVPDEKPSFLEITLLDASNAPVAGQRYEITLPDGTVCTGTLDENGLGLVSQIPRGTCQVSFPDLDSSVWSADGSSSNS